MWKSTVGVKPAAVKPVAASAVFGDGDDDWDTGMENTIWGVRLFTLFCRMFSSSSLPIKACLEPHQLQYWPVEY